MIDKEKYPVKYVCAKCGADVLFANHKYCIGESIRLSDFVFSDGYAIDLKEKIKCPSCLKNIAFTEVDLAAVEL